jgi:integrase
LKEQKERRRFLSAEECQKLIGFCNNDIRPIVVMALNTGMRKGEILHLEWVKNIDLRNGFISLDDTKNGEHRKIPINNAVREALRTIPRNLSIPYVFYAPSTGKPYVDIRDAFARACKRAGIRDFHFHDLRHTFASQLVMAGVDLATVKELLGHKTLSMTLRYAHLAPSHRVNALNILDNTLNGRSTIQNVYNREAV